MIASTRDINIGRLSLMFIARHIITIRLFIAGLITLGRFLLFPINGVGPEILGTVTTASTSIPIRSIPTHRFG
jgi:hypothetical protein